jgi:adenylosuccinate synthase
MSGLIVCGAQWGDEGKGKVVDLYAADADIVARFGGGANAGHTLVLGDQKLVTHLVPSGVLHPGTLCVLGAGMVIDLDTLKEEIAECRSRGLLAAEDLLVDRRAHLILPYHRELEALRESGRHAIGTTRRGIGPAYESKAARRGVRVGDLERPARLRERVDQNLDELAPLFADRGVAVPGAAARDALVESLIAAAEVIAPCIGDGGRRIASALAAGDNVLFEGAQGALLDLDHGTYPFVTSSATTAAGACQGVGVGPTSIDAVVGITKAYCTRVGAGPFPTEMPEEVAAVWREAGQEFGATTGRPRRCGWLDVAALRTAARINGLTALAVTKLDILDGRDSIRVCVGYETSGGVIDELPAELEGASPVYQDFPGWDEAVREARELAALPKNARAYIDAIAELTGVPVGLVSVGPGRDETIAIEAPFN